MRAGWRAYALLLLVTCPLLAAAADTSIAAEAPAWLAEELASLPTEHCQSTWQLRDIAQAAAWTAQVHGVQRSVLAITTCDLHCMRKLFVPWMHSIQNSRDGDFSQHVVIISNGLSAFAYCDSLRARYRHYCVLDRMCLPPSAPDLQHESRANGMRFGRPLYMFALMQKVRRRVREGCRCGTLRRSDVGMHALSFPSHRVWGAYNRPLHDPGPCAHSHWHHSTAPPLNHNQSGTIRWHHAPSLTQQPDAPCDIHPLMLLDS